MITIIFFIYLILLFLIMLFFQARSENEDIEELKTIIRLSKYNIK